MINKTLVMAFVVLMLLAAIPAPSLAASGKIAPYKGMVGADSPFYGLKLFVQHVDESLAGSDSAKLQKQLDHAQERLSEAAAASEGNNTAAAGAALDEYGQEINGLNTTMEASDISEEQYSEVGPQIDDQQQALQGMIENGSVPPNLRKGLEGAYNNTTAIKNGKPFILYNNTTYFVPPGHLKNGLNRTFVPPGLAKKGYVAPQPIIVNGTTTWPFPTDQPGNGKNKTVEHGNSNKTVGNGSDHGNGNGKK